MSNELVRVRLESVDLNMSRVLAEEAGVEILDEPTHNDDGRLREPTPHSRPPKPHTTVAKQAAAKQAASEPAKSKE